MDKIINELLNKNIDELDDFLVIVNNDKPFFTKQDYEIVEGLPQYFEIDKYGRTSGAMAIISRYTLSIKTEKYLIYPNPNGWTQKIDDSDIFQRCHCIAYRLSAKKNNINNIFIGTEYLNKKIMNSIENMLEKYIKKNEKEYIRIIYRVKPIYIGKNQIPTGILMEAESMDSNFTMCRFCYNIEKDVKFNYSDGTIIKGSGKIKKTIKKVKKVYIKNKQEKSSNMDFVINSQTKKYHYENCSKLKNTNPKYIKEITTKEKILIEKGYGYCKVCI